MVIGIYTVYDSANYGSFLQAYAMKCILEDHGHTVKFVKVRKKSVVYKRIIRDCILRKKGLAGLYFGWNRLLCYHKDQKVFRPCEIESIDQADIGLIGSDTMWNIRNAYFSNQVFYGLENPEIPKAAFAVSCADSRCEDFEKYPYVRKGIGALKKVFVRDSFSQDVMAQFMGKQYPIVCDPTLMCDKALFDKIPMKDIGFKYILIYGYAFDKRQRKEIADYAREKGYKTLAICLPQEWCDESINASAFSFCSYIKGAELVITSTFHGTIFSAINHANVIIIAGSRKVGDIAHTLGMESKAVGGVIDKVKLAELEETEIDYQRVDQRIRQLRECAMKSLQQALHIKNQIAK